MLQLTEKITYSRRENYIEKQWTDLLHIKERALLDFAHIPNPYQGIADDTASSVERRYSLPQSADEESHNESENH